jgi:histidyl-tRNA synthetase
VRDAFEAVAREYNFKVMEPASLEHISTLRAKSGEGIDKEIYSFKDKGGREVGLRFDLTVGITRYVCSRKGLRVPVKLAALGGMWRYDEPQYGRFRWSHQWDLEVFGPPSVDSDAEVIDASSAILRKVGIPGAKTLVNDRHVVEEYIRTRLHVQEDGRVVELMRALDKVGKKTIKQLETEYAAKGFSKAQLDSLILFGKTSGDPGTVLQKLSEMGLESVKELEALRDNLDRRSLRNVEYDTSIVRGIDYYTGIVFEGVDPANSKLGSLFGGGRYDSLPKLFGRPELSATGAAGGVEREAMALKTGGLAGVRAYVAYAGDEVYLEAVRVLSSLRTNGIPSDMSPRGRSLAKQLEEANSSGSSWVVLTGKKEVEKGVVTLKNLSERSEEQVRLDEAIQRLA